MQSFQERLAEQRAERESNPASQQEFKGQRSKEESTDKRKAVRPQHSLRYCSGLYAL